MISEASSLTGTLRITPPTETALQVPISTNLPSRLRSPASVAIAAGASAGTFIIEASANEAIEINQSATLTASGPGLKTAAAALEVWDDDWPVLTLSLDSTFIRENAGAQATFLTITRDTARSLPLTIHLSSNHPTSLTSAERCYHCSRQNQVRVPLTAVDDTMLDGAQRSSSMPLFAKL